MRTHFLPLSPFLYTILNYFCSSFLPRVCALYFKFKLRCVYDTERLLYIYILNGCPLDFLSFPVEAIEVRAVNGLNGAMTFLHYFNNQL